MKKKMSLHVSKYPLNPASPIHDKRYLFSTLVAIKIKNFLSSSYSPASILVPLTFVTVSSGHWAIFLAFFLFPVKKDPISVSPTTFKCVSLNVWLRYMVGAIQMMGNTGYPSSIISL